MVMCEHMQRVDATGKESGGGPTLLVPARLRFPLRFYAWRRLLEQAPSLPPTRDDRQAVAQQGADGAIHSDAALAVMRRQRIGSGQERVPVGMRRAFPIGGFEPHLGVLLARSSHSRVMLDRRTSSTRSLRSEWRIISREGAQRPIEAIGIHERREVSATIAPCIASQGWPSMLKRLEDPITDRKSLLALQGVGGESEAESMRFH